MNTGTNEYGGSLGNRVRLVRELVEETKDAMDDTGAVAVRFAADARIGEDGVPETGERREMFAMLAELPDLWDINIADYSVGMGVLRYLKEGALEPCMARVTSQTTKPVVTVGRVASPDAMASRRRRALTVVTDAADAAARGDMTCEGGRTRRRLASIGVEPVTHRAVARFDGAASTLACVHRGPDREIACAALVSVTARAEAGRLPFTLARIGYCDAPGVIAQAVRAGHLDATELEAGIDADKPLRHERVAVPAPWPGRHYLDTPLLCYEDEIVGEADFRALAARLPEVSIGIEFRTRIGVEI
jgi:hypothetical protein